MGPKPAARARLDDDNDNDDDDDFEPSTPHNLRQRNAIPPTTPTKLRLKRPASFSVTRGALLDKRDNERAGTSVFSPDRSQPITEQSLTTTSTAPKTRSSLSLKKPSKRTTESYREPTTLSNANSSKGHDRKPHLQSSVYMPMDICSTYPLESSIPAEMSLDTNRIVVLDSESESDAEPMVQWHSPKIGGAERQAEGRLQGERRPSTNAKFTQESIPSSQGSVHDYQEPTAYQEFDGGDPIDQLDPSEETPATWGINDSQGQTTAPIRWSLSPETSNPFLSDLVAAPDTSGSAYPVGYLSEEIEADSPYTELDLEPESIVHDSPNECMICGKNLLHLDTARMEYHINNCMDEHQTEQDTIQSLDLSSSVHGPSSSQVAFAGGQVDYLARVKRCPICKQDWPLKGKARAGQRDNAPKRAKQKVDHMKRCAKAHKRTVQSLLYQLRLLKERYERSLVLGISGDPSASQHSQEFLLERSQDEDRRRSPSPTTPTATTSITTRTAQPKSSTIIQKQVASLAETTDADFISDAIITTVSVPAPSRTPRVSKLQKMQEDQQDESLQLALALSLSFQQSESESSSPSGTTTPRGSSRTQVVWNMTPLPKESTTEGGPNKRRRKQERNKNETTILPFEEVQNLIQENVGALLFPDMDRPGGSGTRGSRSLCTANGYCNSQCSHQGAPTNPLRTPPWRPSRFSLTGEADKNLDQSQSSESDTSPKRSLWNLSHLKDTREIDDLKLHEDPGETSPEDSPDPKPLERALSRRSKKVFDREKYVSRFMRRFLQRDVRGLPEVGKGIENSPAGLNEASGRDQDNKVNQVDLCS